MAEPTTEERWDGDAPITDAQYAGIWDSAMVVQERPSYSRNVVRKLLRETDRLRDVEAQLAELREQHRVLQLERGVLRGSLEHTRAKLAAAIKRLDQIGGT